MERARDLDATPELDRTGDHVFHHRHHGVGASERHLEVHLGELGLAVGAQVFVAKAAHDLVVAIETRHHQHLLEELGRLRQREEFAGREPARHQEVAGTFGSRARQHRRLDLDETPGIEAAPHFLRDAVAKQQVVANHRAPKVQIAVLKAQCLASLRRVLDRER